MNLQQALARIAELEKQLREKEKDLSLLTDSDRAVYFNLPVRPNAGVLSPQERRVCRILHSRSPNFVSTAALTEVCRAVHGTTYKSRTPLPIIIYHIRAKIEGTEWKIENQWGFGYRLVKRDSVKFPVAQAAE